MKYEKLINEKAKKHDVPSNIVKAICRVESDFFTDAIRYEDHYRWLFNPEDFRGHTPTEKIAQKTSWGLMQVMGAVARELGFNGRFLSQLCKPEIGLEYGCKHLRNLYDRYNDWQDAISAYNQGNNKKGSNGNYKNQRYVDKVNKYM